jgi:hypothetical protein
MRASPIAAAGSLVDPSACAIAEPTSPRVAERLQRHPADAAGKSVDGSGRRGQGQTCLADPAGAEDGDQAHAVVVEKLG